MPDINTDVDTKKRHVCNFGNDAVGFIRVRKRALKSWHGHWPAPFEMSEAAYG